MKLSARLFKSLTPHGSGAANSAQVSFDTEAAARADQVLTTHFRLEAKTWSGLQALTVDHDTRTVRDIGLGLVRDTGLV